MVFPPVYFIWLLLSVFAASLPLDTVNLQDKKVFEIASDNKDYNEQNENEMIQSDDLANLKSYIEDESRYKPLHSFVESYNEREAKNKVQHANTFFHLIPRIWESSITENTDAPFVAGFKDDLDNKKVFQRNDQNMRNNFSSWKITNDTVNTNEDKKRSISSNGISGNEISNVESTELGEEMYDYYKFKKEYEEQAKQDISTSKALNSTDEEDLTGQPQEVLKELLDFENCTDTTTKFGIKALDCLMHKYEKEKNKPIVRKTWLKIWLTIKIWSLIYVCIAIPCWCYRGWCCCCFRCKFCFPRKRILFAKQYYMNYPPGVFSTQVKGKKEKEAITYEPTEFEEDTYEKFETAIRNI